MTKLIFLQDLDLDNSPQVRAETNEDVVEDYAIIYKAKQIKLPLIDVFTADNKTYLLGDGMHRVNALIQNCAKTVEATVHKGGYEDALKFALLANERHGLRRTNEDKRRCVQQAIKQWPTMTDNNLAVMCAVNNHTVAAVRAEMEKKGAVKPEPVRKTKDGRKVAATRAVGKSQLPPVKPGETKDAVGTVIPAFAMQYWLRAGEAKELVQQIAALAKFLRTAQKENDLMYVECNISGTLADLERVWTSMNTAVPYAVCSTCQGHPKTQPKGECRLCKGRGLLSKFKYETCTPAEIRRMKEKK